MCTAFPVLPPASHSADTQLRCTPARTAPQTQTLPAPLSTRVLTTALSPLPSPSVGRPPVASATGKLRQLNREQAASLSQNKALYKPREKAAHFRSSENSLIRCQCGGAGVLAELPDTTQHTAALGFQSHRNSFSGINMPVPPATHALT